MKRRFFYLSIAIIVVALSGCTKNEEQLKPQDDAVNLKSASLTGKFIVVLSNDVVLASFDVNTRNAGVKAKASGLLKKHGIPEQTGEVYESALQGFTVTMTADQAKKLKEDAAVKYVEADQVVTLSPIQSVTISSNDANVKSGAKNTQLTPWGIIRVGGGETYTGHNSAWIIDTGIDLNHPDLNVDKKRGISFVPGVKSPNDYVGHGTWVAGIIAAINNTEGVVGVAAGATVVPVKVFEGGIQNLNTTVIAGVNYVAANASPGDVANISIGGGISQALDDAVYNASQLGIRFTIAAGNSAADASNYSPARVNGINIYTISAMGELDTWASFSNWGNPPVDYCAPGVVVLSTYMDKLYASGSGTSASAPHVAGLLLLGPIQSDGTVINDADGVPDPIAHH